MRIHETLLFLRNFSLPANRVTERFQIAQCEALHAMTVGLSKSGAQFSNTRNERGVGIGHLTARILRGLLLLHLFLRHPPIIGRLLRRRRRAEHRVVRAFLLEGDPPSTALRSGTDYWLRALLKTSAC